MNSYDNLNFKIMQEKDKKLYNITLALAGVLQAAVLVRDLAKSGVMDEKSFNTTIGSIYQIDAANVAAVYDGTAGLQKGLQELIKLLGNDKTQTDPSISRYVISMIHLQHKLSKNPELLKTLTRRVHYAVSQATYFSKTHPNVIASLADIYISTLGTLAFRIQVLGQAKLLNQQEVIQKIRALLLAGVRSVVLWRQVGGRRWQLFLWRNKITRQAQQLLLQ